MSTWRTSPNSFHFVRHIAVCHFTKKCKLFKNIQVPQTLEPGGGKGFSPECARSCIFRLLRNLVLYSHVLQAKGL